MSILRLTAANLPAKKDGELKVKCDSEGYYELILGGLNVFNSVGDYYPAERAKELFNSSSTLQRRIKNGSLKGEVGHPAMQPGMTIEQYVDRLLKIDLDNVCCHFKEIWLDDAKKTPTSTPGQILIYGLVKPISAKGEKLAASLENPHDNTAFSIRSAIDIEKVSGVTHRILKEIITWDFVNEPGLSVANKWNSPAMEELKEVTLTTRILNDLLASPLVATEDSREMVKRLITDMEHTKTDSMKVSVPQILSWK